MRMKNSTSALLIFASLLLFSSCMDNAVKIDRKPIETDAAADSGTTDNTTTNGVDSSLVFAGITSLTHTDSTVTLNWTAHASAIAYDVYDIVAGLPVLKLTVVGQASNTTTISGLTPGNTYSYRVRFRTNVGTSDSNTNNQSATLDAQSSGPSTLTRILPGAASSSDATATIRVAGVKSGEIIHLFSDSSCTDEVATGTASSSSIDLVSSTLPLGLATFAVQVENSLGNLSTCSTATATFTRTCPQTYGDFIQVPADTNVGVSADFCVMKYEARISNGKPYSQSAWAAWNYISQVNARNACAALGSGYQLISNPEWQAIARNIEDQNINWLNGVKGTDYLNRGWSASNWSDGFDNTTVAPSAAAGCLYNTGANTCAGAGAFVHKRTHRLSTGEDIWDISGNVEEWVDWNVTCNAGTCDKAYKFGDTVDYWRDYSELDTKISSGDVINLNTAFSAHSTYNYGNNVGSYNPASLTDKEAVMRGGAWYNGGVGGIFNLSFYDPTLGYEQFGFRCTFRP